MDKSGGFSGRGSISGKASLCLTAFFGLSAVSTLPIPGSAYAGEEFSVPSAMPGGGAPQLQQGFAPGTAGAAGGFYQEYLTYGAYVRRSHMPGFIPQTESLFENPRSAPSALCRLADPYRYGNIRGWFFGSPNGYQSSVPPDSISHAYVTGQLGITSSMQYGYPRGMRVIEPIIVPFAAYAEPGGLYISSEGASAYPPPQMPAQVTEESFEQTVERTGRPAAYTELPRPTSLVPEPIDK